MTVSHPAAERRSAAAPANRGSRRRRTEAWLTTLAVTVVAVAVVVPWLNALLVSFKTDADLSDDPISLRFAPTLQHYANALGAAGYDFPRFFLNSALIALGILERDGLWIGGGIVVGVGALFVASSVIALMATAVWLFIANAF